MVDKIELDESDIQEINNILNDKYEDNNIISLDNIILNPDNSKYTETIIINDNNKNINFQIVCFDNNNIKNNKFKEVIDTDILNVKKKILNTVILKKLKKKHLKKYGSIDNVVLNILIYMKNDNLLKIKINIDKK